MTSGFWHEYMIYRDTEGSQKSRFWEKDEEFSFRQFKYEIPIIYSNTLISRQLGYTSLESERKVGIEAIYLGIVSI